MTDTPHTSVSVFILQYHSALQATTDTSAKIPQTKKYQHKYMSFLYPKGSNKAFDMIFLPEEM